MTIDKRVVVPAVLITAMLALVVILSGSIDSLVLPKGIPLSSGTQPNQSDTKAPGAGTGRISTSFDAFQVILPIAMLFVVYGVVASIRSREFRHELGISLFALGLLTMTYLIASLIYTAPDPHTTPADTENLPSIVREIPTAAETSPSLSADIDPAPTSRWHIYLSLALAIALLIGSAGLLLRRLLSHRRSAPLDEGLDELVESFAEAAERLRAGDEAAGVVRTCYARMVRTLVKRALISPTYMTPREFSGALRVLGLSNEHIDDLTAMFETVRYGGRPDDSFADRALRCLEAIHIAPDGTPGGVSG